MAVKVSITYVAKIGSQLRVGFNLVASGTYVTAAGGDTVDFTKAVQDASFQGIAAAVEALGAPVSFDVWDVSGNLATYVTPTLGTTLANSKVQLQTAVNTELGSGAYPTPMKLIGEASFVSL